VEEHQTQGHAIYCKVIFRELPFLWSWCLQHQAHGFDSQGKRKLIRM